MNKICLLGRNGFIGSALNQALIERGDEVVTTPEKDCKAILHFASTTHIPFEKNPVYHTQEIISSFLALLPFCEEYDIPFIFPSSALIYESGRPFLHLKMVLEQMVKIYNVRSLALRIFPIYGVGEGKRGQKTAIYQWIQEMKQGQRPIVYGDGTQSRDFIYIDDVVWNILKFMDEEVTGYKDIGTGEMKVFNDIVEIINSELKTNLPPLYNLALKSDVSGMQCQTPVKCRVDIKEGIKRMINEIS